MKQVADFSKIKTHSVLSRKNKESINDFFKIDQEIAVLDTPEFNELTDRIALAAKTKKQVIVMHGGHVIKCGLGPYLIEMMKKGIITHIAMNGAAPIHDFEFAMIGESSEWVADTLQDGQFGNWEETGRLMNEAINSGARDGLGYGEAIGRKIDELQFKYKEFSVVWNAYKLGVPVTVHTAIGTEIIHQHPICDGAALGQTSYHDFKLLTGSICQMDQGVALNIGSAVIMPEVFLKALSVARNLGFPTFNITTANLDMIDHYRPRENVIFRPTQNGGKGFMIKATHQVTIPSLYKKLIQIKT